MIRNCKYCGKEFEGIRNQMYCSETCLKNSRKHRYSVKGYDRRTITVPSSCRKKGITNCFTCPKEDCRY